MFTGLVVTDSGRGYWWIEQDHTRDCIFCHQRYVVRRKFLHPGDRVQFNLQPSPDRPGHFMATDVEIIGFTVARQVSVQKAVAR
jgi:hypothetical protein